MGEITPGIVIRWKKYESMREVFIYYLSNEIDLQTFRKILCQIELPYDEKLKAFLAFDVFDGLASSKTGHWYFNANARTATCSMNTILRAFNMPDILLRKPGEIELQKAEADKKSNAALKWAIYQ